LELNIFDANRLALLIHIIQAVHAKRATARAKEKRSSPAAGTESSMMTFDAALFDLYNEGAISYDEAIRNADSANELRLNIKLNSTRKAPEMSLAS
jgi:Tfp pilus assembly ATPase PilU